MARVTSIRQLTAAGLVAGLALCAGPPAAAGGGGDARARTRCTAGSESRLQVRADDHRLAIELRIDARTAGLWRIVVLHERRIAFRAALRATRGDPSLRLRRSVADWYGTDTVAVRATGPGGESCRVAATL